MKLYDIYLSNYPQKGCSTHYKGSLDQICKSIDEISTSFSPEAQQISSDLGISVHIHVDYKDLCSAENISYRSILENADQKLPVVFVHLYNIIDFEWVYDHMDDDDVRYLLSYVVDDLTDFQYVHIMSLVDRYYNTIPNDTLVSYILEYLNNSI